MKKNKIICIFLSFGLLSCTGELLLEKEIESNPHIMTSDMGQVEPKKPKAGKEIQAHIRRLTPLQFRKTVQLALGDVFQAEDFPVFNDDIPTIGLSNDPNNLKISVTNVDSFYKKTKKIAEKTNATL